MKLFILSIFISYFTLLGATSVVGSIKQTVGSVKVKSKDSLKKVKANTGYKIKMGDLIITSKKSTAILNLVDGSILALDNSSTLHFLASSSLEQTSGKVYYKITSRDAINSLKVQTAFAIIGIKGTTFIVDDTSVKLQEGLLGIKSIKEEFELYRKDIEHKFNEYSANEVSKFEKFKQQNKRGQKELTDEFDLQSKRTLSFSENVVDESVWNASDDAEFEHFEKLINLSK